MKNKTNYIDNDESLATRAAWLHYIGGYTQAAVAKRLGLNSIKVHRLIARAVSEGTVKVSIDGPIIECVELENKLSRLYALDYCQVAPDLGEKEIPMRALGLAGANFFLQELNRKKSQTIGIAHGRTLASAIKQLPRIDASHMKFVSMQGGLTRHFSVNPDDVMHRIAEKTGAQAFIMPVPFLANTVSDRDVFLSQRGVSEVFKMGTNADLKIVGIGTTEPTAQLVSSGMIKPEEINQISSDGGVGEILGHFFDTRGNLLETALTARILTIPIEKRAKERLIAIAGGSNKVDAIRAILTSRTLTGLITDECTARALVN
jgi:DNA-binding transcriptional regulator LsrR (DeoR family)